MGNMVIDRRFTKQAGAVAAIAFILVMAGCLAGSDDEPAAGEDPQGDQNAQEPTELEAQEETEPEPVEIRESGRATGDFTREWEWEVASGWSKIQVELWMTIHPTTSPTNYELEFQGGNGIRCNGDSPNNVVTVTADIDSPVFIVNGTQAEGAHVDCKTDGSALGTWNLSVDISPSVSDYEFIAIVEY